MFQKPFLLPQGADMAVLKLFIVPGGVSLAGTFMSPLQTLSFEILGGTPEHWCKVQPLLDANWTQHQVLSLAIPPR